MISTHSPRVGRTNACAAFVLAALISTHSPRVGRTLIACGVVVRHLDFNSLAPCGANRSPRCSTSSGYPISTHSPRVGRTSCRSLSPRQATNFNSLAPCGANPVVNRKRCRGSFHFNSLAPCGANHVVTVRLRLRQKFQLTRPVWGEPFVFRFLGRVVNISTHSPRVGRTLCKRAWNKISYKFQLTRPVWGEPL